MISVGLKRIHYRILSIPISILFVFLAHFLKTPNPMMILIISVVFFSYADGYISGTLSGLISILYSLYFFSNADKLFTYNEINVQKVMTIVAAVVVIVILVGKLKAKDTKAMLEKEMHVEEMARINQDLDKAVIEAQNANKAKSNFLSSVSHDIRTPMNVILGMTNMAMDEIDNPQVLTYCLEKINSSGNFLLDLINDVLDISRIESGKLELKSDTYCIRDFEKDLKSMYTSLCEEKNIEFKFDATTLHTCSIIVDKVRFKKIFFNLISNAIKFTPEDGTITFTINGQLNETNLMSCTFLVQDTGIGMSKEFQKKMFDPFAQENSQYTSAFQGTGLGLLIVKNMIETLNGTVAVESEEGKGTTFTIQLDLPVTYQETTVSPMIENSAIDISILNGKHILIVEDNALNIEIANYLLIKEDMIVTCAENGLLAYEIFKNSEVNYFDAILMDIQMPIMNGFDATCLIRRLDRDDAKTIPIIAMTANAFDDDVARTIECGMNKHLSKPIDPTLLYETLASEII